MNGQGEYVYYDNDEIHQNVEVADEYLYSSENDQITGDEKVNKLTQLPNPTTRRNDRKKRPVSRQDSELYDLATPTAELGLSKPPENVSMPSSTSQDLGKKKADTKKTTGKEGHSITIKCNRRCIFVSILCAIIVLGVGASVISLYQQGMFEDNHENPNSTVTDMFEGDSFELEYFYFKYIHKLY